MDGKEALKYIGKIARTVDETTEQPQSTMCPDAVPFEEPENLDGLQRSLDPEALHDEDELVSPDTMPFVDDAKTSASDGVSIDEDEAMSPDTVPFEDTKNPPQDPDGPLMGQE